VACTRVGAALSEGSARAVHHRCGAAAVRAGRV